MPIVKILPDGKVRIVNSKSGEIKDVAPEELANYAPRLVSDYQTLITSGEVASAGGTPETGDPIKLALQAQQVQKGTFKPGDTAAQEKEQSKVAGIEQALTLLRQNLGETEVQGPLLGTGANLLNKVSGGAVAPQVADYEALRKSLIGPLARSISGEVGVLTDKDIARAEGLLPKITDSKKLRENKIKNLERVIAQKKGTTGTKIGKFTIEAIE